jgi:hypothetical protein
MSRSMMLGVLVSLLSVAPFVQADPTAISNETPIADHAPDKTTTETADEAKEAAEFKIPAGYQAKKRGKKMVYCKKSMESGTRFSQERCFDEEQLRAMEQARQEEQTKIDQTRKVCATPDSCAGT